ncbi:SDR family NAD(P)-dependent oxidoreductase [Streptomyces longispororuber]|uniref:SDR family NAD(P)-dependent oxidoreductase n=1 Tax=Streptomyces longispororuber TaxID=68230 RepID=UPI0027E2285E|nr:SDR family NAD(P)-dependent oxidoreductase [Streptomyces longispororuber]
MDLRLKGLRAVVTGGSRGIGFAVGRALAQEGATVALVSRSASDAEDRAAARAASTWSPSTLSGLARKATTAATSWGAVNGDPVIGGGGLKGPIFY